MPYRCVHCSQIFRDGSSELLTGCSKCKSKFFFYIKEDKLKQILENKELEPDLSEEEKEQMEQDIRDIAGIEDDESPVFLDFESIKVIKPGKYLLDVQKLFSMDKPRVYQIENGKYLIDLSKPIKAVKKTDEKK